MSPGASQTLVGRATQVHAHSEMHPKAVMRLLAPLMMPVLRHMFSKRPAQLAAGLAASRTFAATAH